MTAAATQKESVEFVNKHPEKAIDRRSDTGAIILRLTHYMTTGEKRGKFILAILVRVVALLGLVVLPFLTGQAINEISTPGGTVAALYRWLTFAFIAAAVYLLMSFIAERLFADLGTNGLYGLQVDLFSHIQELSLNFFDRQPIGELMSRVTNDTEVISLFYENAVGPIIRAFIQIFLILIVMLVMDWRLTIVALLVVPVMLFL